MSNRLQPTVDQWYAHLDKGQRFFVTAVDEDNETVEVQHFDGDIEEFTFEEWRDMEIATSVAPENWAGAYDIGESDVLGTEITDTSAEDWSEPEKEFHDPDEERLVREPAKPTDETGEGFMEESNLE